MTIVEFIEARIDEDEAAAREAIEPRNMHPYGDVRLTAMTQADVPDGVRGYLGGAWGEHFARHDPARVLAEVAAKRAIIEAHRMETHWCPMGDELFRALALPYADHPDFDQAWRSGLYPTVGEP